MTSTPDLTFPSAATMVQGLLGMTRGFAFDVQAVCAGFVFALANAQADLQNATGWLMRNALMKPDNAGAAAMPYLHLMALVMFGHMWGQIAKAAQEGLSRGTGDANFYVTTAAFNFDMARFYRKWERDLATDQGLKGLFPNVAPIWGPLGDGGYGGGWGDAGVCVPYVMWQTYGDTGIIQDLFGNIGQVSSGGPSTPTGGTGRDGPR